MRLINHQREYIDQVKAIIAVNEMDFHNKVYPKIINSSYDEVDKTDFLAIIKDVDISKYNFIDTAAREYLMDLCDELIEEAAL